jgi:hypothetical protein
MSDPVLMRAGLVQQLKLPSERLIDLGVLVCRLRASSPSGRRARTRLLVFILIVAARTRPTPFARPLRCL